MPTVAISVDCDAAHANRCYTRELVRIAEEYTVPLTWLIFVSELDPTANINLYHNEYLHRIPSWHEIGLLLSFENSRGYISDPKERGDLVRIGKDVLKACHVKATSFRAFRNDLLPDDLRPLEDIGILVDASATPGAVDKHEVTWPDGPKQPYHPSYENLSVEGDARILMAPIATHKGQAAILDHGWERVEPVIRHSLANLPVTVISLSDHVDCSKALRHALELGKQADARFVTLTEIASC
jgi:hypothetical protein